mmetsp:Transcript_8039/g.12194  ORF Transcript_8039/g.12194 Transcript_8039/m.12194 type:complete len:507 (-) Transcript_8039:250-1770(-)
MYFSSLLSAVFCCLLSTHVLYSGKAFPNSLGSSINPNFMRRSRFILASNAQNTEKSFPKQTPLRAEQKLMLKILKEEAGFSDKELEDLAEKYPPILNLTLDRWFQTDQNKPVYGEGFVIQATDVLSLLQCLKRDLGMSKKSLKQLITKHPIVVTKDLNSVAQNILYLREHLKLDDSSIQKLFMKEPQLMTTNPDITIRRMVAFLRDDMHLGLTEIQKIVLREPFFLRVVPETRVVPIVAWLQEEFGFSKEDLGVMMRKTPTLFALSLERNLKPKMAKLVVALSLSPAEGHKLLRTAPSVFLLADCEERVQRLAQFLVRLGIPETKIKKSVLRQPSLLSRKIESMQAVVDYLFKLIPDMKQPQLSVVLTSSPSLLCKNLNSIQEHADFLVHEVGVTHQDLLPMIIVKPQLISSYSIEKNLKPTWEFLLRGYDKAELAKYLARRPSILGCSLEARIKPRIKDFKVATGEWPSLDKLGILSYTDERWCRYLGGLASTSEARAKKLLKQQ